ncbi:TetR/AcrR family transcriptional regulator [Georgenia deserti]|uniref:TetR/AcrR family transcriptional regulator n=1 Tax=Georgenia deserti TaxID=2093781 RepID=A0ABW4L1S0_9MICO
MTRVRQGGGRPRESRIDAAVLAAARELLAEVGYAGVTMDATAARAGTSKAAIYRRFRSKAELMFAAAVHRGEVTPPPDTGSLRGDLLALARTIRDAMSSPAAREVAPQVLTEIRRSPAVSDRLREVFVTSERSEIETVLDRAVGRGELMRRPDIATVHRILGGALFFGVFVVDEDVGERELHQLVAVLSAGVVAEVSPHLRAHSPDI